MVASGEGSGDDVIDQFVFDMKPELLLPELSTV